MKIPFDTKYRPEIESGKCKVETRDGHSVRIICWDRLGSRPIIALVEGCDEDEEDEGVGLFHKNGSVYLDANNNKDSKDLFIITDEKELTEFEKELAEAYEWAKSTNRDDFVKEFATSLLDLARKELLKDLPKWKYMRNGACGGGDRDCFLIRTAPGYYFLSPCVGPDTIYLKLEELEKLPKEN